MDDHHFSYITKLRKKNPSRIWGAVTRLEEEAKW
jgi:hypothetical protein